MRRALALACSLGAALSACAATHPATPRPATIVIAARVFDGTTWHDHSVVTVSGDHITSLRALGAKETPPASALAPAGAVLTPGLLDLDSSFGLPERDEVEEAVSKD